VHRYVRFCVDKLEAVADSFNVEGAGNRLEFSAVTRPRDTIKKRGSEADRLILLP
jgi:hypothetical protein